MRKRLLSVIVPAFRQEKTIKQNLENIHTVLEKGLQNYDYEIICIVDGTIDGTLKEAKKLRRRKIRVIGYKRNRGKGYAVRFGMARSRGSLVSFLDAGRDISPKGIMMLMAHMEWYNADVIIGSKRHPVSRVNYPFVRHAFSIGYHLMVKLLFGLPLTDTQSGIKIFKRKVLEKVLPRLLVKKYAMDVEMLAVAYHLGFKRIYEAPIEINFRKIESNISWPSVWQMLLDTLGVFYRLKLRRFYNWRNRRHWRYDPKLDFRAIWNKMSR